LLDFNLYRIDVGLDKVLQYYKFSIEYEVFFMQRGGFDSRSRDGYLLDELREELLAELEERSERQKVRRRRYPRRDLGRLRREVYNELNAMRAIENRLRRSRVSPEARVLLNELMDEAADQGLTIDDLFRSLPRQPLTERLADFFQSRNGMYLLLAMLVILATPSTREMVKPALKKVAGEVNELADQVRGLLAKIKEGLEDVVAEARFEKMKEAMEQAIYEDLNNEETRPGPQPDKE